jgi:hypothetical protein
MSVATTPWEGKCPSSKGLFDILARRQHDPHSTILGENLVVIYLVQYALMERNVGCRLPNEDDWHGVFLAVAGFALFHPFCHAVAYRLHRGRITIKL